MSPATAGTSAGRAREQLLGMLEPLVVAAGFDLEDVTVSSAGRRSLVRVVVDADGGVDLDGVAAVSRVVSDALDASVEGGVAGALPGSYVLEVTSPGVSRPLREPRHWRRAAGRLVTVRAGEREVTGRVVATQDTGVTLDVDGERRELPWEGLGPGTVQVEFNREGEQR